jgi:hypothetical protein
MIDTQQQYINLNIRGEMCMIPLEHFRTIDYVHVREGRLVYLQKRRSSSP